jgi:glyceraldehyde-3-phosphate dehydrogenase/erythrose-4-phosphate dehydrogenase
VKPVQEGSGEQTYKVVVWATGGIGRYAMRTITDRPNLELVGVTPVGSLRPDR